MKSRPAAKLGGSPRKVDDCDGQLWVSTARYTPRQLDSHDTSRQHCKAAHNEVNGLAKLLDG